MDVKDPELRSVFASHHRLAEALGWLLRLHESGTEHEFEGDEVDMCRETCREALAEAERLAIPRADAESGDEE